MSGIVIGVLVGVPVGAAALITVTGSYWILSRIRYHLGIGPWQIVRSIFTSK
jgi:hypothetical protein